MAALTKEQIEQKKQLLADKLNELKALCDELQAGDTAELSDDELAEVAGGIQSNDLSDFSQKVRGFLTPILDRLIF